MAKRRKHHSRKHTAWSPSKTRAYKAANRAQYKKLKREGASYTKIRAARRSLIKKYNAK